MTLHVIGAGFGRTGTDSMRIALNMLGLGPTHHMRELRDPSAQRQRWLDLARGAAPDWDALFDGYRSSVDWPSAFYWRELMQAYPEALVLLTWRSPESWWSSFQGTILKVIQTSDNPDSFGRLLIGDQVFGGRPDDRAHAIAVYKRNVDEVIATVPERRLLIHRLGDGWGPLCARLGLPVPAASYPNRNARADFVDRVAGPNGS